MSGSVTRRVGELGELFDGPHATPVRRESGPRFFLSISSLISGRLDLGKSDRVDEDDFIKWTRRVQPREHDLLFSYETRLGEAALMPAGIEACLGRRMGLLRPDLEIVDPRYLLYAWLAPAFQQQIAIRSIHGATVSRIPLVELADWPISIHERRGQSAIAEVLGALDGKIAANRRVLALGDELVRVRYDSLSRGSVRLGEIADEVRQKVEPVDIRSDCVYVGLEHFGRRSMWLQATGRGSDVSSTKSVFADRDVLFGKLRPYFHKVSSASGGGVCSTDVLVVRAKESRSASVVLAACASDEIVAAAVQNSNGTRMPRAKWADIAACSVPDPGSAEAGAFVDFADAVRLRCLAAIRENDVLSTVRDELLPLLMDGRITVKEAEKRVDDVV